jgi:uncharacterized membrane protein YhdT
MKTSFPQNTVHPDAPAAGRATAWLKTMIAPSTARPGSLKRRIHQARQLALTATVLLTLVQMIIWLMIAIGSGQLDGPWWLWTAAGGAFVVLALSSVDRLRDGYRNLAQDTGRDGRA